jgi:hypothetical protein
LVQTLGVACLRGARQPSECSMRLLSQAMGASDFVCHHLLYNLMLVQIPVQVAAAPPAAAAATAAAAAAAATAAAATAEAAVAPLATAVRGCDRGST